MFDIEDFVRGCRAALDEEAPHHALREVVESAVTAGDQVAEALRPQKAGFTLLHHAADLTVLHVVWAPHMTIYPHDHRMWAVIGIYAGQEDNRFFGRTAPTSGLITEWGGKRLGEGEVAILGANTIHSVTNPRDRLTGALHVYSGDFVNQPRSQWGPGPRAERPYDIAAARQHFAEANAKWRADITQRGRRRRPEREALAP